MEVNIDFVVYMKIIGLLMAFVAVTGAVTMSVLFQKHNREREERLAGSPHPSY